MAERTCKKIIVCCDGTAHSAIKGNDLNPYTNVLRLSRCIKARDSDGCPQIIHYISGIGTSDGNLFNTYLQGTGIGIDEKIKEAYNFICHNYETYRTVEEKDEIFLIGFSRGAYVARCVADIIDKVGILTKMGTHYLPYVYDLWKQDQNQLFQSLPDEAISSPHAPTGDPDIASTNHEEKDVVTESGNEFMYTSATQADPDTDTLKTETTLSSMGSYANTENELDRKEFDKNPRHILANAFYVRRGVHVKVCAVWDTVAALGRVSAHLGILRRWKSHKLSFVNSDLCNGVDHAIQALSLHEHRRPFCPIVWRLPKDEPDTRDGKPRLQQCWFMGYHSDVGGGIRGDVLSHYPLAWMMSKLECFIELDRSNFWNPRPKEMSNKYLNRDLTSKVYWLAGTQYRLPNRPSWLPELEPRTSEVEYKSFETLHFTVDRFLSWNSVKRPKMMKDAKFKEHAWHFKVLPPRSVWHRLQGAICSPRSTQMEDYSVQEDIMSEFEKVLLMQWVRVRQGMDISDV
ncbi:hypothetical protein F4808DRAFT_475993 [Astrocystis sublimbata]|nr:hypothetical protein F4808DRAFT_475993 [Astrocystis sublimbata]